MSPILVCFFTFFVFVGIAVQFAVCGDECDQPIKLGSDECNIGILEKFAKNANNKENSLTNLFINEQISKAVSKSLNLRGMQDEVEKIISNITIFPGTKWCGSGNKAKDENDLGRYNDTDTCCRAHDNCCSNILVGETKQNLKNNGFYTRSNCLCDNIFYNCLKKANSPPAILTGLLYFEILRPQCFECVCPVDGSKDGSAKGCKKYAWRNNKKWINGLKLINGSS